MFDVFATILSAGVVISVVTLVVHEPLLLAAGISTLLGLMFVLLPMFVTMVPMLGYLLIFVGLVSLGYGVLSTRSWLNELHTRRAAALARKRSLYGTPANAKVDSTIRQFERVTGTLPPGMPKPAKNKSKDKEVEKVETDREDDFRPVPRQSTSVTRDPDGPLALARLSRGLNRTTNRSTAAASASAPFTESLANEGGDDDRSAEAAALPPLPPLPASLPPVSAPPPVPGKVLSRGAERIRQVKAQSRQSAPAARRTAAPVSASASATPPATSTAAVVEPVRAPEPVAPPPAARDPRKTQRMRDLLELGLLDVEPEAGDFAATAKAPAERPAKPERSAMPFVARLARRG